MPLALAAIDDVLGVAAIVSDEPAEAMTLREALRLLTYGSTRAILREVDRRLGDVRPRPKNF